MKKSFMDRFYIDDGKKELNKAMIGEVDEEVVLGVVAKSNFDGVYIDEVGALEKSSFYDIMEKGTGEKSGHKYLGKKPKSGGGWVYDYEHGDSKKKYEVHESKDGDYIRQPDSGLGEQSFFGLEGKAKIAREKQMEDNAKIYDEMKDVIFHHKAHTKVEPLLALTTALAKKNSGKETFTKEDLLMALKEIGLDIKSKEVNKSFVDLIDESLNIMEKAVKGGEVAGHRWASREMRPGGGYIYHYTHASGAKHDLHEDDGGGKTQIEGRTIREHGKKATEYAKAADAHFGAGREKEGMKNFKQAVKHREAQEILRHHYFSKGKNQ